MDRALFHADNSYYWPNYHAVGMLVILYGHYSHALISFLPCTCRDSHAPTQHLISHTAAINISIHKHPPNTPTPTLTHQHTRTHTLFTSGRPVLQDTHQHQHRLQRIRRTAGGWATLPLRKHTHSWCCSLNDTLILRLRMAMVAHPRV